MKRSASAVGLVAALLLIAPAAIGGTAAAQAVGERVAAVVNDHPISTFDVSQRMRLMVITQGVQVPEEALPKFQQQALRDLVDEQLKLQEAERFDLTISDDEIDEEIAQIASSGGTSPQQLQADLASSGIDIGTLREKIRAEQAWERLVRGRYGSRVNVTPDEVETFLDTMRDDAKQPQFLLSEICLPVESAGQAEQMYQAGLQLVDQMRRGVPFRALAQQFSACPTAARGGDMGWMKISDLNPDLGEVVTKLDVGNVSRPIPVDGMMRLIAVRQKRGAAVAGEPGYRVVYAGAPVSIGMERAENMAADLPKTNGCESEILSADLGKDVGVTILPMLKESQFDSVFHDVLAGLNEGEVSPVIESEGAYHTAMLCEKDEGLGLPSKRMVENRLEAEELERISRRYLRDVERDSAVEIRLNPGS